MGNELNANNLYIYIESDKIQPFTSTYSVGWATSIRRLRWALLKRFRTSHPICVFVVTDSKNTNRDWWYVLNGIIRSNVSWFIWMNCKSINIYIENKRIIISFLKYSFIADRSEHFYTLCVCFLDIYTFLFGKLKCRTSECKYCKHRCRRCQLVAES